MSFIRPEARAQLWAWRELIAAVVLFAFGLRAALGGIGLMSWFGWGLIGVSLVVAIVAAQRMRFRLGSGGPGVVQVVEGQISYFGPLTGGAIAVSELDRVTLDHTAKPAHWVLDQPEQPSLAIPVTARGAERLFDAFSALPGLQVERMLKEMHRGGAHQVVIWERSPTSFAQRRLH